jgi:hypothetical protein
VSFILAALVVIGFALIIHRAGVAALVRDVTRRARANYSVVSDRSLSDEQKERRLREETPLLLALLARIVIWSTLALALPLAAVWIIDRLGLASLTAVLDTFLRIDFIIAITAAGLVAAWWLRRRRRAGAHHQ